MTPEEEHVYQVALRRIQEAEKNKSVELDLSNLSDLTRFPSELAGLTSLQSLNLSGCEQLSGDLAPLAGLTSLQSLNLSLCLLSGDLAPLAGLTSLQSLNLSRCEQLSGDLAPLVGLTSLQALNLSHCVQLSGDLSPLSSLTSLESLNLNFCEFGGDLAPLACLTSLQSLRLMFCRQLSGDLAPLANLTSLQLLVLSYCDKLGGDLIPLANLTSLQWLSLSQCDSLSGDLTPLASLTSLQWLNLSTCWQFSDLSPLSRLTSLQELDLCHCGVRRFDPLECLLPALKELFLFECQLDDLPPEVCGERSDENVLDKVRAHYADLRYGARRDTALKVFFLGNGGAGKTQLCRRLRNLEFDPSIPTTHGVQLGETTLDPEGFAEPVRLNLWDFGGQDIYHGSHALFLHAHAIFLILWTPELEQGETYDESGLTLRHRPLSYWLDYLRAFAGTDTSVLIVQSQCDSRDKRRLHPPAPVDDFPFHRHTEVSARTGLNLGILKEYLKEAARDRFNRRPPPPIGVGRLKVRNRLRQMLEEDQRREPAKRQHRLLECPEFDRLCEETGGVSDKVALLDFLHHNGVLFYRPGLFGDRIVLDQNWALEAIYSIFHRDKCLKQLKKLHGRFSREDLEPLIWSGHTPEEQKVFLGMMESCGICFKARWLSGDEWEYIAPELLPEWSGVQELLLGRLRDDPPDADATASYAFLHDGILRNYLSKLGEHAKDAPIYWKYGCWFYERKTSSQALIESSWDDVKSETGAGTVRIRGWGQGANNIVTILIQELQKVHTGHPPTITGYIRPGLHALATSSASIEPGLMHIPVLSEVPEISEPEERSLKQLQFTARPEDLSPKSTPEIFISYAWGDDSSEISRKRGEVVERLCDTLAAESWKIIRDTNAMRPGDLISAFMKRIGLAGHVILVLSDKYLRSPYCMTELHTLYQNSRLEKQEFLDRIIPLVLDDARFGTPEERVEYAKHWEARYRKLKSDLVYLSVEDFARFRAMQKWHLDIGEMLTYINDVLCPHGFDDIVKDNFARVRKMLSG